MFTEKKRENITTWQFNNLERLLIKIDRNLNRVLKMILDIQIIYIEYLNQANNADK